MAEKILLGMSGGLDSTYSALALKRQGWDVVGAVLKMSENTDIEGAKRAAEAIGVKHYVVEQDNNWIGNDPFRSLKASADFLAKYRK